MFAIGLLIFLVMTVMPGFLALRLFRVGKLNYLDAVLYSVGLSLIFNILAGAMANFTLGFNLISVAVAYGGMLAILAALSFTVGRRFSLEWDGRKKHWDILVPVGLYLLAVALQYQTTMISINLVGSDIHYEFYHANLVLTSGFWDPMHGSTPINACAGITLLLPVYSILTRIDILWIFKAVSPMIIAVLPLVLYRIFKVQFGTIVAALSVVFFVSLPFFTMDLVQLVRQQQAELFFVLVVLVLLDGNWNAIQKIGLGAVFGAGVIISHYGLAVGYTGYMLLTSVAVILLAWAWRKRKGLVDIVKPIKTRLVLVALVVLAFASYFAYYSWVSEGNLAYLIQIPGGVAQLTVDQVITGGPEAREQAQAREKEEREQEQGQTQAQNQAESPSQTPPNALGDGVAGNEPSNGDSERKMFDVTPPPSDTSGGNSGVTLSQRLGFLNPFTKEPLLQTAIGLDFAKASALGKTWRILQYLVEICLAVGFFSLLLRPPRKTKIEYMGFVLTSFFIVVGLYLILAKGYGLGSMRVLGIASLFLAPLFVLGIGTIGSWVAGLFHKVFKKGNVVLLGMAALFLPYYFFNSGVPFELAKRDSGSFIDIPYSIALSGHRVDIASIFEEEDIWAVDWLREYAVPIDGHIIVYTDYHGFLLLHQKFDNRVVLGEMVNKIKDTSEGYIFLRKRNVDNNEVTLPAGYGCRASYSIDSLDLFNERLRNATVLYKNGAQILLLKVEGE